MAVPKLVRTGDHALDRNFDEMHRVVRDVLVAGRVGPAVVLATGVNKLRPAVPHPSGRATLSTSDGTVTLTDGGLDNDGNWLVTASGAVTLRSLWLE